MKKPAFLNVENGRCF